MITRRIAYIVPLFAASLVFGACSDDTGDGDPPDPMAWYNGPESAALGAAGNQATCETCHASTAGATGYSGNTFADIAYNDDFKNGAEDLLGGINACVTGWMGGTALTASDEGYMMLEAYLQEISDPAETTPNAIMPEVLDDEAAYELAYAGGDAAAGEAVYNSHCGQCHDSALIVGTTGALAKAALSAFSVGRIAQKVRTSGPPPSGLNDAVDSTPGPMPFFEMADLSQQDLADIIAHIKG